MPAGGLIAALMAAALWGSGPVLAKAVDLPGMAVVLYRLWLGGLITVAVLYARRGRLSWRVLRLSAAGGLAFGVNISLFFSALKLTSVANATVISALQPALLFLVVGRLFGEEIGVADVAWTAVAIGGVGVVVFGGHATTGSSLRGNLLATGALFTWAWYFVASKRARRHLGALEYQSAMTLIAATVATPIAVLSGERLSLLGHRPSSWLWIGLIVIGGGGGHLLMNYAHASVRLTITSLLTLSTPVLAAAGAAVFLHEPLRVVQGAGMALVIAALAIVITRRSRAEALLAAEEGLAEPR